MATLEKKATGTYVVAHPIRHNGKLHGRGRTIELHDGHSARLLAKGVIKAADIVIHRGASLGASTLEKLTVPELFEYARTAHSLSPKEGITKAELLSEIAQAALAAEQSAEAENDARDNR